jgi:molybdopterin synthase catalytic subunit
MAENIEDIFAITRDPINKAALEARLLTGAAGAVVTFDGVVREQTKGRRVVTLQYEAYEPMAVKEMRKVGAEIRARWPEVLHIGMIHRFGELQITESSIVIVITSPHRRVAFEACHYAIDRVKETVPIWKKEIFEDGEAWVEGTPVVTASS